MSSSRASSWEGWPDGSVAYVTLDNPPANSYDLPVMRAFAADVDAAIASDARVVVVRSASEKFFSAGADVKKFLDGDVEANMEMIRTSQAAFRRMAAAEQVFIAHSPGTRSAAGWRSRSRATCASRARAATSWARLRSRSACCPATAARSG